MVTPTLFSINIFNHKNSCFAKTKNIMEMIKYYSKNGKKPPFEVDIQADGKTVYVNCNCEPGIEKNICRHKINAIRGDKENRHSSTSDEVILRLRSLLGMSSSARLHLEEQWRLLREFSSKYPGNEAEISNKRKLLGMDFANGFLNSHPYKNNVSLDTKLLESADNYNNELRCSVTPDLFK